VKRQVIETNALACHLLGVAAILHAQEEHLGGLDRL
jgi:hypothetical protein